MPRANPSRLACAEKAPTCPPTSELSVGTTLDSTISRTHLSICGAASQTGAQRLQRHHTRGPLQRPILYPCKGKGDLFVKAIHHERHARKYRYVCMYVRAYCIYFMGSKEHMRVRVSVCVFVKPQACAHRLLIKKNTNKVSAFP